MGTLSAPPPHHAPLCQCHQLQHCLESFTCLDVVLDPNSANENLPIAARCHDFEFYVFELVCRGMVEQTHQLNTVSFNSILSSIEGGGHWHVATSLVSGQDRYRLFPDMLSFSLAIRACQADGQEAAALEFLRGAQALQLCDTFTFNSAIGVCHVGGDWSAAIGLLERMIALGLQPDVISQSSLISVCFEKTVEPDLFCLNSTLSTCEKARRLQAALRLLQSSVGAGSLRLEP